MAKSPYDVFGTSEQLETQGVRLDYGAFYITILRAGGSNKKFQRILEAKMRPHRRAIQTETLDENIGRRLLREVVAESIVIGWGCEELGEGKIVGKDGAPLTFSPAAACQLFEDLPDLFNDVYEQAGKASLFRQASIEADAKN